jgi:hypothetical protein
MNLQVYILFVFLLNIDIIADLIFYVLFDFNTFKYLKKFKLILNILNYSAKEIIFFKSSLNTDVLSLK